MTLFGFHTRGAPVARERVAPPDAIGLSPVLLTAADLSLDGGEAASERGRGQATVFAAIQFTPEAGNVERNSRELKKLVRGAARNGAQFIVLPEYALTGPVTDLNLSSEAQRVLARRLWLQSGRMVGYLAQSLGVWLAIPLLEDGRGKEGFFSTTLLIDPRGQVAAKYRKIAPRTQLGDGYAAKGAEKYLQSVETPLGRIGILSGDDVARGIPRLAYCGATTILISASWESSDATHWTETCVGLAKQYKVNLVISNLKGVEGQNEQRYGSIILKDGRFINRDDSAQSSNILYGTIPHEKQPLEVTLPLGLPSVPQPTNIPLTAASVELGRKLFFDEHLSRDGRVSCASCHEPVKAFADGRRVAEGVFGRVGKKNTPTLLNSGYKSFLSWEGRVESLEAQVQHAMHGWPEMSLSVDDVVAYLRNSSEYREGFRSIGVTDSITFDDVTGCIANYVRTLVSGDSPFDRYYFSGMENSISASAKRGFNLFRTKANCATCHQIKENYALLMDEDFHNTGVGYQKRFDYLGYSGDGLEGNLATKNSFRGEYLTPSLRNVALTAPYMHDGSLATLEDVVQFYNRGGNKNPRLDPKINPLKLTTREQRDLVEFLRTLTSRQATKPAGLPIAQAFPTN
jgi:cytochrome c peroxidase